MDKNRCCSNITINFEDYDKVMYNVDENEWLMYHFIKANEKWMIWVEGVESYHLFVAQLHTKNCYIKFVGETIVLVMKGGMLV
jgi:hypothetical protein